VGPGRELQRAPTTGGTARARSTNQGPPGQGHFVEEAQPPLNGGARKAPLQLPCILAWACSSAGAWVALVIESFFGVDPRLDGTLAADGCMHLIDSEAKLCNLRIGGRLVDVHVASTVIEVSSAVEGPVGPGSASPFSCRAASF
jgi:hypothetical protein